MNKCALCGLPFASSHYVTTVSRVNLRQRDVAPEVKETYLSCSLKCKNRLEKWLATRLQHRGDVLAFPSLLTDFGQLSNNLAKIIEDRARLLPTEKLIKFKRAEIDVEEALATLPVPTGVADASQT